MICALALLLLQDSVNPADVTLAFAPPRERVAAGTIARIGVYFRNPGTTEVLFVPPAEIGARLVLANSTSHVALKRVGDTRDVSLPPGGSLYVDYDMALPNEALGRVVIELERLTGSPGVIDVGPAADPQAPPDRAATEPANPDAAPPAPPIPLADFTLQRFSAHEPMYFLAGGDRPNARFQFSFKYQVANPESPLASRHEWVSELYLGYTQTSLWDWVGDSAPFTDTNYKPEVLWSRARIEALRFPFASQVGLEAGVTHESNGRARADSRSLNTVYVRPVVYFGDPARFHVRVAPKVYAYWGDLTDNDDIDEYRGYCDLSITAGRRDALEIAAIARLGIEGEHGSIQVDATYPLRTMGLGNFDMYLQAQYFGGYGESLITYDERTDAFRVGIGLAR